MRGRQRNASFPGEGTRPVPRELLPKTDRQRTAPRESLSDRFGVGDEASGPPGLFKRGMVSLGLVSVGHHKLSDRRVELIAAAQVAIDGRSVAGAGMGVGQCPAAQLRVTIQAGWR